MNILCIEDNIPNLVLIEQIVKRLGQFEIWSSTDGRKGLESAERNVPDLILLDYHLPQLSGDVVLTRLKENPKTAHIPVYVLSADIRKDHIRKLKTLGAADYLTKPLDINKLISILTEEAKRIQSERTQ